MTFLIYVLNTPQPVQMLINVQVLAGMVNYELLNTPLPKKNFITNFQFGKNSIPTLCGFCMSGIPHLENVLVTAIVIL